MTERTQLLYKCIDRRVLLLDGSMGVMIQSKGLGENDFRGSLLSEHPQPLKGNNDILCLTSPEVIAGIHREYLEAGADIIETNTFNATRLSQKEYSTDHLVRQINTAGAQIARREADRYSTPERPRFVAGSIGPTGIASSMSADINDPASRPIEFAEMSEAFEEQAGALIDGGVDMLLIETIFDSLNAKAAIDGAKRAMRQRNTEIPLILSMTVSDRSGRLLSGHTAEAFLAIIAHAAPLAVGFNCSAGPTGLAPFGRHIPIPHNLLSQRRTPGLTWQLFRNAGTLCQRHHAATARRYTQYSRRLLRHYPGAYRTTAHRNRQRKHAPPSRDGKTAMDSRT